MWHASAAGIGRRPHKLELRGQALIALAGVGDKSLGEWHEWSGYAYHVRRRLSVEEQKQVGDALDCRGTEEGAKRLLAISHQLPREAISLAKKELLFPVSKG